MAKISGKKFRDAREAAGLKRTDLEKVSKMTYTRIHQIETDEVSHVNDLAVDVMAKLMKVKPEQLAP